MLIVFDMDGVLVDVSKSYRDAVRQTVRLFFTGAKGSDALPDPLCRLSDIADVKQSGGLNNDWELTYRVVCLLYTRVDGESDPLKQRTMGWPEHKASVSRWDVSNLVRYLQRTHRPLRKLLEESGGREVWEIEPFFRGDVGSGNIIKQIFQELYLGKSLFESTYPIPAGYHRGDGYIHRERLLIEPPTLRAFANSAPLAVATGRPRTEAEYTLKRFQIDSLFSLVYTLDDCLAEEQRIRKERGTTVSLSKPHPYMLDAIAEALGQSNARCIYVGDMPDDMIAAARSRAPFESVGVLYSAPEKERLRDKLKSAGAEHIIDNTKELARLLLQEKGQKNE